MEDSNVILSAPLQQLKNEHVSLRADMERFYEITEEIEYESGSAVSRLFVELVERISAFTDALLAHSAKEEKGLFPLVTRHLSADDHTIEAMEFEHEKAERHLQVFLNEAGQSGSTIDESDAQAIAVYAVQAYTTLTQHFGKEEKILFPLAENLLSADEKEELQRFLRDPSHCL